MITRSSASTQQRQESAHVGQQAHSVMYTYQTSCLLTVFDLLHFICFIAFTHHGTNREEKMPYDSDLTETGDNKKVRKRCDCSSNTIYEEYQIKKQTVSGLHRCKEKLLKFSREYSLDNLGNKSSKNCIKMQIGNDKLLEEAVYKWYNQQQSLDVLIWSEELKSVARKLAIHISISEFSTVTLQTLKKPATVRRFFFFFPRHGQKSFRQAAIKKRASISQ